MQFSKLSGGAAYSRPARLFRYFKVLYKNVFDIIAISYEISGNDSVP
jgi:hypothetical protein